MSDQLIDINLIDSPTWNSRLYVPQLVDAEKADFDALCASMAVRQLQPILVEPKSDGRYELIYGSRRLRAAQALKWERIRADVREPTDAITRVVDNVEENLRRRDLSTFEIARAAAKLRELKLSLKDSAERLNMSVPVVSNYAKCYELLDPHIKERWQAGDPVASINFLRKICGEKHEKQEELWNARAALVSKAEEMLDDDEQAPAKKKKPAKDKPDAPYKVDQQRYYDLVTAIKKANITGGTLAINACKYLVGEIDKIKGIIAPEPAEDKAS